MASLLQAPYSYFSDANGAPLAGGKVYTYSAGTTTNKATYTDNTESTPAANPIILDSAGRAAIWVSGTYRIDVKDSTDVLVKSTDNVASGASGGGSFFTTEASIVAATTTDIGALLGQEIVITGNTAITSLGTSASLAAPFYFIRFTGTPTLTNSGTLIIAGGANYTAAAGDVMLARFEGSGTWRVFPMKANGQATAGSAVQTVKRQVFASSGTYTPSTGMLYCDVEAWGGGGGGGGVSAVSGAVAGGGAAGSYARKTISAATVGVSQTVTIGAGGTAGANTGGTGGTGGTTTFGAIISALGGLGGVGSTGSVALGGAGQAATGGDINGTGAPGGAGFGNNTNTTEGAGFGGSTSLGGGALAKIGSTSAAGNAGVDNTGGGGGGANGGTGTAQVGGVGGKGYLIVTEYCSQ